MSLRTLERPHLLNTFDHDLFQAFFVPALTHAFRYDRGVGYFASGWLRPASQGMVTIAAHRGAGAPGGESDPDGIRWKSWLI
jgi:hypothetical protein